MFVQSSQSPLWAPFQVHYIILEIIVLIDFNWTILNLHRFTLNLQGWISNIQEAAVSDFPVSGQPLETRGLLALMNLVWFGWAVCCQATPKGTCLRLLCIKCIAAMSMTMGWVWEHSSAKLTCCPVAYSQVISHSIRYIGNVCVPVLF